MKADMVRHFDQLPPAVRSALRDAVMNIPAELVQRAWWRGDFSVAELVGWIRAYDRKLARGQVDEVDLPDLLFPVTPDGRRRRRARFVRRFLPMKIARLIGDPASR